MILFDVILILSLWPRNMMINESNGQDDISLGFMISNENHKIITEWQFDYDKWNISKILIIREQFINEFLNRVWYGARRISLNKCVTFRVKLNDKRSKLWKWSNVLSKAWWNAYWCPDVYYISNKNSDANFVKFTLW